MALGLPDAPDWIRGGLGIGKIVIASPLNPPPGSDFNNVLNTAVHEFVHIIPTFKDLDTGEDFEKFFQLNGYQYSYTIVESIICLAMKSCVT